MQREKGISIIYNHSDEIRLFLKERNIYSSGYFILYVFNHIEVLSLENILEESAIIQLKTQNILFHRECIGPFETTNSMKEFLQQLGSALQIDFFQIASGNLVNDFFEQQQGLETIRESFERIGEMFLVDEKKSKGIFSKFFNR